MESAQITKQLLSFAGASKRSMYCSQCIDTSLAFLIFIILIGSITEFDWSKIKDMDFQESWKKKQSLLRQMDENFQCVSCPDLEEHVSTTVVVHAFKYQS